MEAVNLASYGHITILTLLLVSPAFGRPGGVRDTMGEG